MIPAVFSFRNALIRCLFGLQNPVLILPELFRFINAIESFHIYFSEGIHFSAALLSRLTFGQTGYGAFCFLLKSLQRSGFFAKPIAISYSAFE